MSEFEFIEKYTRRRMRELNGQAPSYDNSIDPFVENYTRRRMRELRVQEEMRQRKISLDNMALGGYTVVTMEAYRPHER